jgi:hypothetical protein
MQYNALALADMGIEVDLIGYDGSSLSALRARRERVVDEVIARPRRAVRSARAA